MGHLPEPQILYTFLTRSNQKFKDFPPEFQNKKNKSSLFKSVTYNFCLEALKKKSQWNFVSMSKLIIFKFTRNLLARIHG